MMARFLRVTLKPLPSSHSDVVQLPDDWDDMTEQAKQDFRIDMVSMLVWEKVDYVTKELDKWE